MVRIVLAGLVALIVVNAPVAAEQGPRSALLRAGEQGMVEAQLLLGAQYLLGHGVARDPAAARRWYERAADQGDPKAQTILGLLYIDGTGVAADPAQAVRWFRRAALQGSAEAQLSLGALYADGEGVARDPIQAHMWLTLAVAKLPQNEYLMDALRMREVVARNMTPDDIEEATRLARELRAVERQPGH